MRLATRARKTAQANARARTEVSPNPFNNTRTNMLSPINGDCRACPAIPAKPSSTNERCPQKSGLINAHFYVGSPGREKRPSPTKYKSDLVKAIYRQYDKLKLTYRYANPRWHKLALDPLPGGSLCLIAGGLVFSSEVDVNGTYYKQLTYE